MMHAPTSKFTQIASVNLRAAGGLRNRVAESFDNDPENVMVFAPKNPEPVKVHGPGDPDFQLYGMMMDRGYIDLASSPPDRGDWSEVAFSGKDGVRSKLDAEMKLRAEEAYELSLQDAAELDWAVYGEQAEELGLQFDDYRQAIENNGLDAGREGLQNVLEERETAEEFRNRMNPENDLSKGPQFRQPEPDPKHPELDGPRLETEAEIMERDWLENGQAAMRNGIGYREYAEGVRGYGVVASRGDLIQIGDGVQPQSGYNDFTGPQERERGVQIQNGRLRDADERRMELREKMGIGRDPQPEDRKPPQSDYRTPEPKFQRNPNDPYDEA